MKIRINQETSSAYNFKIFFHQYQLSKRQFTEVITKMICRTFGTRTISVGYHHDILTFCMHFYIG